MAMRGALEAGSLDSLVEETPLASAALFLFLFLAKQLLAAVAGAYLQQQPGSSRGSSLRLLHQQNLQQHRLTAFAALAKAATALLAAARSACSSPFKRLLGSISPLHEHQQHHRGADRTAAETEGLLADAENSDEGSCRLPLRFTCGCSTNQHPRISSAAAAAAAHVPIGGDIVIAFNPNAGSIEMALAGGSPEMESYLKK
ncbi:hypothetical protein cyc_04527 [Cyclospora cayetanensis]|uniref:Uncharacterized protein n=1 Tax=Cyclospora cayetanensis TaxID=88456 RepID=A0A1D3D979_9EIME|nr:hypothetical protein cyc_04527 [Cyclospora cayetanensis]